MFRLHRPALFFLLLASPAARAAEAGELAASAGQMLLGLLVVVGLLLATLWLMKRLAAPHGGAAVLKVLGATPVGPRERVVLVEVADKVLVLGVAPGQVTGLATLDRTDLPVPTPAALAATGFQARLRQALEGRK